ncbi:MAG: hypothetical protein LBR29_01705, partial [Methylobacteriaceae bacterium]|nr:hypothetical protein [Methylobacteriaceae bacterium]
MGARSMRGIVIEAPSGYGKTTVTQDFLMKALPKGQAWIRHVCTEESSRAAWRHLCRTIQKIDPAAGEELLQLGAPDSDTLGDAQTLFREMECKTPVWFVIDDFHQIAEIAPVSLWKALLEHDSPNLHVVLLTRPLRNSVMPYVKSGFLRLVQEDLRLTERECGEYFAASGFPLTEENTAELYRRTGGWMIALTLHLRRYRTAGEFASAFDLDGLVRDVVWNVLDEQTQNFLLRLSPFDAFSAEQAVYLTGIPEPGGEAGRFLRQNAFLRFDTASGEYYVHSVVLEFVREIFAGLPRQVQADIIGAAGDWCASNG